MGVKRFVDIDKLKTFVQPALVALVTLASLALVHAADPYVLGADISFMQQREREGVRYYRNGQVGDLLAILKGCGFNYIRLRLFVDPTAEVTEAMAEAECKSGGWCAAPYSRAGYCGLDSTIKVAKRVKAAGMKLLLDFHYSDTWADPGKQYKPMSWRALSSAQLTERVRSYTKESLEKFKDAGVLPDMVQVGNEVVGGMIHPDGSGNTQNFAALVNAGIRGVKDVDAGIKIMMHTINERNPNGWLTALKANLNRAESGAANKIDVIGLSYYPRWHGNLDSLQRVLTAISNAHDVKIAVAEYADKHREVNDLVYNLPSGKGLGTFVWEPQEFDGDNSLPLFDWRSASPSGRHSNARLELYPVMAMDYGLAGGGQTSVRGAVPWRYAGASVGNLVAPGKNAVRVTAPCGAALELFDLAGARVAAPRRLAGGVHSIPLGHLPKGAYVVKVSFPGVGGAYETRALRVIVM
jgi:arabinogalactan endo-1,4-beta-galactosidase